MSNRMNFGLGLATSALEGHDGRAVQAETLSTLTQSDILSGDFKPNATGQ